MKKNAKKIEPVRPLWTRGTAVCLLVTLLVLETARTGWSLPAASPDLAAALKIPASLGTVESFHRGRNGKTLFYIQDAHHSVEAQENIARILGQLVQKHKVKTVFEEGYEGPVPTQWFREAFPDAARRKKASWYLLDRLRLGGAEYAHINRSAAVVTDFKLIGADDEALHQKNIRLYRKAAAESARTAEDLKSLRSEFNRIALQEFPKPFKAWMNLSGRFHEEALDPLQYLLRTRDLLAVSGGALPKTLFPQICRLLAAAQTGKSAGIHARQLYQEMEDLENWMAEKLLKADSRPVWLALQKLRMLEALNALRLSSQDYEALLKAVPDLGKSAGALTREMGELLFLKTNRPLVLSCAWERQMRAAREFYQTVEARDRVLARKLKDFSDQSSETYAALVFGGFHKHAVLQILEEQGWSYAVLQPRIRELSRRHETYYRELMTAGHFKNEKVEHPAAWVTQERLFNLARDSKAMNRYLAENLPGELRPDVRSPRAGARAEVRNTGSEEEKAAEDAALFLKQKTWRLPGDTLVYPAAGIEAAAVIAFVRARPEIKKVILVDSSYAHSGEGGRIRGKLLGNLVRAGAEFSKSGSETLRTGDFDFISRKIQTEFVLRPPWWQIWKGTRPVRLEVVARDYLDWNARGEELPQGAALTLVQLREEEAALSWSRRSGKSFYEKVLNETALQGVVYVGRAFLPAPRFQADYHLELMNADEKAQTLWAERADDEEHSFMPAGSHWLLRKNNFESAERFIASLAKLDYETIEEKHFRPYLQETVNVLRAGTPGVFQRFHTYYWLMDAFFAAILVFVDILHALVQLVIAATPLFLKSVRQGVVRVWQDWTFQNDVRDYHHHHSPFIKARILRWLLLRMSDGDEPLRNSSMRALLAAGADVPAFMEGLRLLRPELSLKMEPRSLELLNRSEFMPLEYIREALYRGYVERHDHQRAAARSEVRDDEDRPLVSRPTPAALLDFSIGIFMTGAFALSAFIALSFVNLVIDSPASAGQSLWIGVKVFSGFAAFGLPFLISALMLEFLLSALEKFQERARARRAEGRPVINLGFIYTAVFPWSAGGVAGLSAAVVRLSANPAEAVVFWQQLISAGTAGLIFFAIGYLAAKALTLVVFSLSVGWLGSRTLWRAIGLDLESYTAQEKVESLEFLPVVSRPAADGWMSVRSERKDGPDVRYKLEPGGYLRVTAAGKEMPQPYELPSGEPAQTFVAGIGLRWNVLTGQDETWILKLLWDPATKEIKPLQIMAVQNPVQFSIPSETQEAIKCFSWDPASEDQSLMRFFRANQNFPEDFKDFTHWWKQRRFAQGPVSGLKKEILGERFLQLDFQRGEQLYFGTPDEKKVLLLWVFPERRGSYEGALSLEWFQDGAFRLELFGPEETVEWRVDSRFIKTPGTPALLKAVGFEGGHLDFKFSASEKSLQELIPKEIHEILVESDLRVADRIRFQGLLNRSEVRGGLYDSDNHYGLVVNGRDWFNRLNQVEEWVKAQGLKTIPQVLAEQGISAAEYTTLVYPASGIRDMLLFQRLRKNIFSHLSQFHLADPAYHDQFAVFDPLVGRKVSSGEHMVKRFTEMFSAETGPAPRVYIYDQYYEKTQFDFGADQGRRVWLDKGPGRNAELRKDDNFYLSTLKRGVVRPGDLVLAVPFSGTRHERYWHRRIASGVYVPEYYEWALWDVFQVTEEDFTAAGLPVPKRSELRRAAPEKIAAASLKNLQGRYSVVMDIAAFNALSDAAREEFYKLFEAYQAGARVKFIFNAATPEEQLRIPQALKAFDQRYAHVRIVSMPADKLSFNHEGRRVVSVSRSGIQPLYSRFVEKQKPPRGLLKVRYGLENESGGLLAAALLLYETQEPRQWQLAAGGFLMEIPGMFKDAVIDFLASYIAIGTSA